MPPPGTKYAEIQQDEIDALRSIYMDDFEEQEAKVGAWNKIADRGFKIQIHPNAEDADIALTLAVSLPQTYPKTLPQLSLSFGPGLSSKAKLDAQEFLRRKPKELLGSEMIFEIATALQDILDNTPRVTEVPSLEEERVAQHAATQHAVETISDSKNADNIAEFDEEPDENTAEEEQALAVMMEQAKSRSDKRKVSSTNKPSAAEIEASDGLQFDNIIITNDGDETVTKFDIVHSPIYYRQGPVTKVCKVYVWGSRKDLEPHLVLKTCVFSTRGKQEVLKEQIFDLDQRLDKVVRLPENINIMKPLSFAIKRSFDDDDTSVGNWKMSILMDLASKGSMQDLLETVTTVNLGSFRAWALQLLEGLMFYHRHGIVHASVHPRNILLIKADTGNTVAKLSDASYQHAIHVLKHGLNTDYASAASTNWVAPEVMIGSQGAPIAASDVWDLGTCFLQMLFGLGVQGLHSSPKGLLENLELSQSLEEFLDKIFRTDHKRRPSAFELLPSAFLRNNDDIFAQTVLPQLARETSASVTNTSSAPRRRRESTTVPTTSRFRDDFVEAGRLGRGGYGEVIRARNKLDGRFYAIKMIKSRSASALNDVLSEIILLSQLNHPNVVRYFNAWLEQEESSGEMRARANSNGSSSTDSDREDDLFDGSRSGLDFMSESGPNIVFEDDSDDDAPKPRITSDNEAVVTGSPEPEISVAIDDESSDDTEVDEDQTGEDSDGDQSQHERTRSASYVPPSKSTLYIQMEYCEKKTLRDLIRGDINADLLECWRIFRQILEGLSHIHASSIVHRDLKPENIFIDAAGDVRIGDFGLARPGDYQASLKTRNKEEAYTSFTKSVGTAFYVAPEVRSAGKGKYNEKADMYSLGIIFFEMCTPIVTGMERVETLNRLRQAEPVLSLDFKRPEKSVQGDIILSLVSHDPSKRPSSSELLAGDKIPEEVEGDKWARHFLRHAHKESYRKKLLSSIFPQPEETQTDGVISGEAKADGTNLHGRSSMSTANRTNVEDDEEYYPKVMSSEMGYHSKNKAGIEQDDPLLRNSVRERITSTFRCHGATEVEIPTLMPFSSQYLKKSDQTAKVVDPDGNILQLPFDFTLPYARHLAKTTPCTRKTYTIGNVFRASSTGGPPRRIGEVHFDIISTDYLDLALREAEAIKVIDEIVSAFPSMSSLQICYHINHSRLLNAILGFCNIHRSKWPAVKDILASVHAGQTDWAKLRATLRSSAIAVGATSVEELMRFDFRDVYDKAIPKLRSLLKTTESLEAYFAHMEAVTIYLKRYNVNRKVYINPLGSVDENFYRRNLFFQCIFDTPKREVFAAGGRYDRLIELYDSETSTKPKRGKTHAVGFNFNWDRLCASMARFQRAAAKSKSKRKAVNDHASLVPTRCDILVASADRELLHSAGLEIIQELWANDISAELIIDKAAHGEDVVFNPASDNRESYYWIIYLKADGYLKVRSVLRKDESEMRVSELFAWLRNEIRERERVEGRLQSAKLNRQQDAGGSGGAEADVRVITSASRGKKFNRKTVIEEAIATTKETVNNFLDGPIVAVETKDEFFDGLRHTRISDPESWRKFIQTAPADDRAYLRDVQKVLHTAAKEPGARNAFLYNFRTKACIYYDLTATTGAM